MTEHDSVESLDRSEILASMGHGISGGGVRQRDPLDWAAIQAVGRTLMDSAPKGWVQLRHEYRATIQIDGDRLESVSSEGLVAKVESVSRDAGSLY
ncbi:hypothetical protein [Nocardia tengchongensis]|uniref:hypothetical protein n=1 Tax=Nocardia tengchongensis TaxID=2055889 RepID=UPI003663AE2E